MRRVLAFLAGVGETSVVEGAEVEEEGVDEGVDEVEEEIGLAKDGVDGLEEGGGVDERAQQGEALEAAREGALDPDVLQQVPVHVAQPIESHRLAVPHQQLRAVPSQVRHRSALPKEEKVSYVFSPSGLFVCNRRRHHNAVGASMAKLACRSELPLTTRART